MCLCSHFQVSPFLLALTGNSRELQLDWRRRGSTRRICVCVVISEWVSGGALSLTSPGCVSGHWQQPPAGCSTSASGPPSPRRSPPGMWSCLPSWPGTPTPCTWTQPTPAPPPLRGPSSTASSSTVWCPPCSAPGCRVAAASSCTKRSASPRRCTSARRCWRRPKSARSRCRLPSSPWRAPSRTRWWWRARWWWWCRRISRGDESGGWGDDQTSWSDSLQLPLIYWDWNYSDSNGSDSDLDGFVPSFHLFFFKSLFKIVQLDKCFFKK